jgi:hypothetical protein
VKIVFSTLEAVRCAVRQLEDAGKHVSAPEIRAMLGGGSYSTIQRHWTTIRGLERRSSLDTVVLEELLQRRDRELVEALDQVHKLEEDLRLSRANELFVIEGDDAAVVDL